MSANYNDYMEMFGNIEETSQSMAKCACVACNSCTCACSCRSTSDFEGEIEW